MYKSAFNFHDLVGFELYTDDAVALDFFEQEYAHTHRGCSSGMKIVRLHWYRGAYSKGTAQRMIAHSHKALARWKYAITVEEELIDIVASGNRFALPMIHHVMVQPSLRFLVSMNQTILLHGAALATDTCSFVFSGPGGMGKTTLSSVLLAERGDVWKLHADDYVFLRSDGYSFAHLTRPHLYRDLLRCLPEMRTLLTLSEKLRIEILGRIRAYSHERLKWPVRISHERLWQGYGTTQKAILGGLCILSRGDGSEPVMKQIEPMSKDIQSLLDMNFYEAGHYTALLSKAMGSSFTNDLVHAWRKREEDVLYQLQETSPFFMLQLPDLITNAKGIGDIVTGILLDGEE